MAATDRDRTKEVHVRVDKNPDKNFLKAVCGFLSVVVELLVTVKLPRPVSSASALTYIGDVSVHCGGVACRGKKGLDVSEI